MRPFKSIEQMQDRIFSLYQERVKEDDTVYFLGDLMFEPLGEWVSLFQALPGKKNTNSRKS